MYIEDIFYANIGTIRDFVGNTIAFCAMVWGLYNGMAKGLSFICETFGITEK